MIAWLLMKLPGVHPIEFTDHAPRGAIADGRTVYRQGAGIDRTLMSERSCLGTWFDGRVRRPVDTVTWVSPNMVARWIGYQAERDGWDAEAIQRRWSSAKHELANQLTFVVRLSAFPKLDPLDYGTGSPPKPESMRGVRFRLAYSPTARGRFAKCGPVVTQSLGTCAAMIEKEAPADVTGRPFYSLTKLAPLFLDEGEVDQPDDGIPLGEFYGAVYLVAFPVTPPMFNSPELDITIQLASKREYAHFTLLDPPAVAVPHLNEDD